MSSSSPISRRRVVPLILGASAAAAFVLVISKNTKDLPATAPTRPAPQASVTKPVPTPTPSSAASETLVLRPLPVSRKTATHEWTAEDATRPEVIEKIAHNPDEYIRLVEENDRIKRRQLVYRNETVPMLLDRARNDGRKLENFILPGLDGREVEIEVKEIHEEPSLGGGSLIGRVKGRPDSMVSVGFVHGCESFNVLSPEDGLFLTADAREPGEVIVKEIDPDKYAPMGGKEPDFILTQEPAPTTHDH